VAVVGGFASTSELADRLRQTLASGSRTKRARAAYDAPLPDKRNRVAVTVPGKEQADIALAFPVLGVGSRGYYDLEVIDTVLGRYGLMGRIGDSVRQKQGLAYYAFSSISPGQTQSLWFSRAGVDPGNVDRAIESILAVTRDALETGITAEELEGTRQLLTGRMALAMQTNAGIAELLQTIEEFEFGLDYVERYPALLAAVTPESARAALGVSLDLDCIQIAVAGPN
jgi:zinc protease